MRIVITVPDDDAVAYVREVARQLEDEFTSGHVAVGHYWDTADDPTNEPAGATPRIEGRVYLDAGQPVEFMVLADGTYQQWAGGDLGATVDLMGSIAQAVTDHLTTEDNEDEGCEGHEPDPARPDQPMGETVYCDGTCKPNGQTP
jgi:hypothetical protein